MFKPSKTIHRQGADTLALGQNADAPTVGVAAGGSGGDTVPRLLTAGSGSGHLGWVGRQHCHTNCQSGALWVEGGGLWEGLLSRWEWLRIRYWHEHNDSIMLCKNHGFKPICGRFITHWCVDASVCNLANTLLLHTFNFWTKLCYTFLAGIKFVKTKLTKLHTSERMHYSFWMGMYEGNITNCDKSNNIKLSPIVYKAKDKGSCVQITMIMML